MIIRLFLKKSKQWQWGLRHTFLEKNRKIYHFYLNPFINLSMGLSLYPLTFWARQSLVVANYKAKNKDL